VGNLIQERRRNRQLSAGEVARLLGVSEWTVRSWESGRSRPTKRHARALARVLKVTVQDLGLEPSRQPAGRESPELKPLAAAIIVRDGRVLLTERRFPGHGEQWSWPSGKIEGGESLQDAILRELVEELLITNAEVIGYLGDIDLPSGFRMSHFHVAIPPDADPKLNDYEQLVRTAWMTRDEVRQAFGSLPPEVARQALVFLDQVLAGQPSPLPPEAPVPDLQVDSADAQAELRAARAAERREWARRSAAAPPPAPGPPTGGRPTGRTPRP
jgi:8-oxo-dGTP diphosphatase